MNYTNKLERRFGRYAIKNLTLYMIIAYGIGYLTAIVNPTLYNYLLMDPKLIFQGQIWRLFTWICTMPQDLGVFTIFMFMFIYWVGTSLERYLGTFKYNVYIFSGYLFMTVGALLIYLITYFVGPSSAMGEGISVNISTYYINLASFLAFALFYGEMQVYFMFIIPVKVRWLAILDLVLIGYDFIKIGSSLSQYKDFMTEEYYSYMQEVIWCYRITIIISLLNFLIFYLMYRKGKRLSPKERAVRHEFKKDVVKVRPQNNVHTCEICKRTSEEYPDLVFRYCSKCKGNHEYCQDHLFTHQHIQ